MKKQIVFLLGLILITACGSDISEESRISNRSERYSYELKSDCSTGKQTFSSFEALCDGLRNEFLNKGCSRDLRRNEFRSLRCPGIF